MTRALLIQLSDELERQLTAQAERLNVSLESLILRSLAQSVNQTATDEADPILPLIGTLRLETSTQGENHDQLEGEKLGSLCSA